MAAFSTSLRFLKWKMDGKWKMENAHRMGHRQVWGSADFGERPPFGEPLRCHALIHRMSLGLHESSERWEEGAGSCRTQLAAHVDLRTCPISAGRQLGNREDVKSAI